jgi:DNA repair protein RadC
MARETRSALQGKPAAANGALAGAIAGGGDNETRLAAVRSIPARDHEIDSSRCNGREPLSVEKSRLLTAARGARVKTLTEIDYLAAIITINQSKVNAHRAAQKLFAKYGGLSVIMTTPRDELAKIRELGVYGASNIEAARRIIVQAAYAPMKNLPVIGSYDELTVYLHWITGHERRERVHLLSLDAMSHLLCDEVLGEGSSSGIPMDITTIVRQSLRSFATSIIIVHNHPCGSKMPSPQDRATTEQLQAACNAVGIHLADHIIVSRGGSFSFRQVGLLTSKIAHQWSL